LYVSFCLFNCLVCICLATNLTQRIQSSLDGVTSGDSPINLSHNKYQTREATRGWIHFQQAIFLVCGVTAFTPASVDWFHLWSMVGGALQSGCNVGSYLALILVLFNMASCLFWLCLTFRKVFITWLFFGLWWDTQSHLWKLLMQKRWHQAWLLLPMKSLKLRRMQQQGRRRQVSLIARVCQPGGFEVCHY